MKSFEANGREYDLIDGLRNLLKPDWAEMLKPATPREIIIEPFSHINMLILSEIELSKLDYSLVGKNILEVGCGYGDRSYLMARYDGSTVLGIDIDEYTVDQSPDMNSWNPKDVELVHNKIERTRKQISKKFPESVVKKVEFLTVGMEKYYTDKPHDIIISWDTLEHIIDIDSAFRQMAQAVKPGGMVFHEFNSFFSLTGGHSLCTLDFHYGHCRLTKEDFERYIQEYRPVEEKIAMNFYHRCLNRLTINEIRELAQKYGFEILVLEGHNPFQHPEKLVKKELESKVLVEVEKIYPKVTINDLFWDSTHLIMRKT